MPAWWNRKFHKIKAAGHRNQHQPQQKQQGGIVLDLKKSAARSSDEKSRSFDDAVPGIWRRNSSEYGALGSGGGSSGFSGFDSDGGGGERRGLPLPQPSSGYHLPNLNSNSDASDRCVYGSVSVSSVSSSVSSEGTPHVETTQAAGFSRRHDDVRLNPHSRSPGPGSRVATTSTSPLHPRLAGINVDYPSGRQEDGRSQGHPLPLPPSSPASASPVHHMRVNFVAENSSNGISMSSKWMKGELLGRGSFGHVYKGFNSEAGEMCAIKEVKIVGDDQIGRESFKQLNQEINLLSQLKHPNIVRYYGSELGEEALSVYLEYVSGGSIHKLLQQYGPFKEPVIKNYTRQILSGLAYLHTRKTVHRDIKGANILVETSGVIKLADFGMAKHITSCSSVLSFKGSPYWMAPEVVINTNGYNLAVDIWSLGCTILEMTTTKPPWSQYEGVAAIFKIGNSKDIPEIPDHLSNDAKSFLKLCLQRDPSARPSAAELQFHPFVFEQATTRIPQISPLTEAFPLAFDGSHHLNSLDIIPRRKSISSYDVDLIQRPTPTVSRDLRESTKTITSLPVSPCSSPLRQNGPASRSCFFTPPNPVFGWAGRSSYDANDFSLSLSPTRVSANYNFDPWHETTAFRSHTPGGSPRTRPI
ncbi:hypothetical protein Dimus_013824 [Dionaea muscipula]